MKQKNYQKLFNQALDMLRIDAELNGASPDDGEFGSLTTWSADHIVTRINVLLTDYILPKQDELQPFCTWDGRWTYPMFVRSVRKETGTGKITGDIIVIDSPDAMAEAEALGCPVREIFVLWNRAAFCK